VDLRSNEKELTLSIHDYGCGMGEDRVSVKEMHYGIAGMQERMRRIGGGLQIEGRPGTGTTVRLHLRWGKVRKELAGV
jgi:signal transduction histidine kinase